MICPVCNTNKKSITSKLCSDCWLGRSIITEYGSGKYLAYKVVNEKIRSGELLKASCFSCVDCGRGATGYDHRDYGMPLFINPVCHKCNILRGHAKIKNWSFDEFMEWFIKTINYSHSLTESIVNAAKKEFYKRLSYKGKLKMEESK